MGGIAPIAGEAGNRLDIFASEGVASPAARTIAARSAKPPDACAVAWRPAVHSRADRFDGPDHFMSRHAWIFDAGHQSINDKGVAVANAAGMNLDEKFTGARDRQLAFDAFQLAASAGRD